jgi:hypothetical protein
MKLDLYAKSILTLIAAALLWLCFDSVLHPRAAAAQGPVKVIITGVDRETTVLPVKIIGGTKFGLLRVDEANPLAVTIVPSN